MIMRMMNSGTAALRARSLVLPRVPHLLQRGTRPRSFVTTAAAKKGAATAADPEIPANPSNRPDPFAWLRLAIQPPEGYVSPYHIFTLDVEFLASPYQEKVTEIALQDYYSKAVFRAVVQPPTLTPKVADKAGDIIVPAAQFGPHDKDLGLTTGVDALDGLENWVEGKLLPGRVPLLVGWNTHNVHWRTLSLLFEEQVEGFVEDGRFQADWFSVDLLQVVRKLKLRQTVPLKNDKQKTMVLHFLGHKVTRPHTALQDARYTADLLSPIMRHMAGQDLAGLVKVESQVVPARINSLKLVTEPKGAGSAAASEDEE